MTPDLVADDWVPAACTLPDVEQPLRGAEFDRLFVTGVLTIHQESPQRLRLALRPDPETVSRAAGLAARETSCCSFFTFDLSIADGAVSLGIGTGPAHITVLAALGARVESRMGAAS